MGMRARLTTSSIRRRLRAALVIVCLAAAIAAGVAVPQAAAAGSAAKAPTAAPLNPEFRAYLARQEDTRQRESIADVGGYLPSPADMSRLEDADLASDLFVFPAQFDLRTMGKLTPVRDQGPFGTCWAFGAYGSLESFLLPGSERDFSEEHMALTHGFDWDINQGGNLDTAVAYLVRWGGPVGEADDPYGDETTPPGLTPEMHVQDVLYLPPRATALDNDDIKWALQTYGAVNSSLFFDTLDYDSGTYAFYNSDDSGGGHGVDIVGWDDTYPASAFASPPPGDGAFIVRNSWGSAWGDAGYFYVSYYDEELARHTPSVFTAEPLGVYDLVYQYDPLGRCTSMGYGTEVAWMANRYVAGRGESLKAVAFYALGPGTEYEVYLGSSLTKRTMVVSGSIDVPGYRTVALPAEQRLPAGKPFYVIVRLREPAGSYPVAVEVPIAGYSSAFESQSGQSFMSDSGRSWTDMGKPKSKYPCNVCLKAYTVTDAPTP